MLYYSAAGGHTPSSPAFTCRLPCAYYMRKEYRVCLDTVSLMVWTGDRYLQRITRFITREKSRDMMTPFVQNRSRATLHTMATLRQWLLMVCAPRLAAWLNKPLIPVYILFLFIYPSSLSFFYFLFLKISSIVTICSGHADSADRSADLKCDDEAWWGAIAGSLLVGVSSTCTTSPPSPAPFSISSPKKEQEQLRK